MKKLFRKEIIIGVCVILALVILFCGIEYLKGINLFKAANYYYVCYEDAKGLTVSAPVSANGFKVGLVRDIRYEYDNPGHVLVELSLDKELKVPRGTLAQLGTDLLGTSSITLVMGEQGNYHQVGDTLAGEAPSGMMDAVASDILPSVVSMVPKIDTLLTNVNALVCDPAVINSVKRLDAITANLEASTAQLNTLVGSLSPVLSNVEGFTGNLNAISGNLEGLSEVFAEMPLDSTIAALDEALEHIRSQTDKLNSPDSSLGLLLNDTGLYDSLNGAASSLDSLLIDIKKNPKRYISIKLL